MYVSASQMHHVEKSSKKTIQFLTPESVLYGNSNSSCIYVEFDKL